MPERVFISYSRRDAQYKDKVLQHLRVLETQGLVKTWSDDRIIAGSSWHKELSKELHAASIVILLITANFLTSDFILKEEVPRAFENGRDAGVRIIPVLCRPCAWETVEWLSRLQMWPANAEPLWRRDDDDPEQLLSDLALEIARLAGKPLKQTARREAVSSPALTEQLAAVAAEHGPGLTAVVKMVRLSITAGAPAYNSGDHETCATVYKNTVKFILSRLKPVIDQKVRKSSSLFATQSIADRGMDIPNAPPRRSMPEPSARAHDASSLTANRSFETAQEMLSAIVKELTAADDFTARKGNSPTVEAWRIRHAFDRLLILAEGLEPISQHAIPDLEISLESRHSSLRHTIMRFLRAMDEIADRSGIDSDDDYEVAANTSATLGIFASRHIAEILELTIPRPGDDEQGLHRQYDRLTRIDSPTSHLYRTIYHSRQFLRAALTHKDS